MGKVEALAVDGLELWFWSGDHEPPHFHVKKAGEWEMKVYFLESTRESLSYEVKWGRGPSGRLQAEIARRVITRREALLDEWERKTQTEMD